jgi:hypothetical protein
MSNRWRFELQQPSGGLIKLGKKTAVKLYKKTVGGKQTHHYVFEPATVNSLLCAYEFICRGTYWSSKSMQKLVKSSEINELVPNAKIHLQPCTFDPASWSTANKKCHWRSYFHWKKTSQPNTYRQIKSSTKTTPESGLNLRILSAKEAQYTLFSTKVIAINKQANKSSGNI